MADDKIDILEIRETSELLVGNKMTDDKVDIMEVPVAEKSVDVPEILEISELQVGNKMTADKIDIVELPVALKLQHVNIMANKSVDVPEILETSEFQVGDIMVVPEISENSEFEAGDIMTGEKIDVSEIPENSKFEILGDEKIDVLENSELEVSGDVKKFSTGYAVVTNRAMIIRSRYLKATMGSCHDVCKYGIRNAVEENGKNPKIKRSISLESVILAGRNKQLALDRKPDSQGLGNATSQQFKRSITFQGLETVQEKNVSATLDRKSSLQSVGISERNEGLGLETIQEIVTSEELARDNNDSESRELDYDPSSVVTSLSDKLTPLSKSGLLPPVDIDVISPKPATVPKLKTKLSKATPGSLKSIRVGESRKTEENGASPMNSAGKDKKLTTSKTVLVPPPVVSSPTRSVKKLASVTNVKSPKKNLVERSNKTNASKLKPVQKNSEDIPEKTLYIIESSVTISDDLSPSSSSSSENKNSKHVRNNERSPPPVEKKSLRTPATRSRPLPSSEKKGAYGSRAAKSSSRQNETESKRQKVHLKTTLAALSTEKKVVLRRTQYRNPVSPALTEKKVVLRRTQHGNPVSPALSTEKKPVLRRTQFGTPVSRSSTSPASMFPSRYSVSGRKSSQHDKNGSASQKSNLKVESKSVITKRTVINPSEDKDSVAQKLKFRRGKVIEPQSTEIVAPRRLKFKRRVIVDCNLGKGDTKSRRSKNGDDESNVEIVAPRRLTFKRRVIVDNILGKGDTESRSSKKGDDECKVEIDSIQSESSNKIMLKHHQDVVECKRDSKTNLYNNVIEETASKLVETRKSKVKALVGAFETVISLQEKKPN